MSILPKSSDKLNSNILERIQKEDNNKTKLAITLSLLGVILFVVAAATLPFKDKIFSTLFQKTGLFAVTVTNLITNGDFEAGNLSGWTTSGAMAISSSPIHRGSFAARSTGGNLSRTISVTPGKTYKVTGWVYLVNVSGGTWGGPRLSLPPYGPDGTSWLQDIAPKNTWVKVGFTFTPTTNTVELFLEGNFGDRTSIDISFDDIAVFEQPATNAPPTAAVSSDVTTVNNIPGTVIFTSNADDPDGWFETFWDFGDGGKSNLPNPNHTYSGNGSYTARLTVYDDGGLEASAQTIITVNDPNYPSLTISNPSTPTHTTSTPSVNISGTASPGSGSTITKVEWSTDRGKKGTASGTSNWSTNIDFSGQGGKNRVMVNAIDSSGKIARKEMVVDFRPTNKVTIQGGAAGVTQNASTVEQYEKFEATFSLQDSVASNPYVPYETGLPTGMKAVKGNGVTVEGIFSSPSGKTYTQPGFFYQPFQRNTSTQQLIATGNPVFKIRFAPTELGNWTYQVRLTDASGTTTISDSTRLRFSAVAPTNPENHGFIKVSSTDKRYFAFSDGTPFIGVGPGPGVGAGSGTSFDTDSEVALVESGKSNLSRDWMSGTNVSGSSWAPWTAGIAYEGNYPGTSLTTEEAYGDGIFSYTLPQVNNPSERCSFYGLIQPNSASIKQNTNYQVMMRVKAVGVTGSGGLTFRPAVAWPNTCDFFAGQPLVTPYVTGTKDWHVVSGTWNSGSNTKLGYGLITLENVTAGRVYIDEISIREDLGGGNFGPEVLPRSKFNVHEYFSQEQTWNWDYGLDAMASIGAYHKIVIEEKGDYAYNHIAPSGFGFDLGERMQVIGGASHKYQEYFWRYLTARYGYSRAVHSWEFVNEDAPGNLAFPNEMAKYFHSIDPQRHLATTSFWAGIDQPPGNYYWQNPNYPDIDYADAHSYVGPPDNSSWLNSYTYPLTIGNITIPSYTSVAADSALYTFAHSMDVSQKNAAGNKPMIIGEAGFGNGAVIAGNNDNDTQGIWLHQFIWSQVNPGSLYFIYWYDQTIRSNNLYPLFGTFRKFMEGQAADTVNKRIPLTNGNYQDIQLTLPAGVNGWGQKDVTNGGVYFWLYDRGYSWTTPAGGAALANKQVSFGGLPAKTYTVEFWNSWPSGWSGITNAGQIISQDVTHAGGIMTLTIPATVQTKDIAVKIYPKDTGYPGPSPAPTPSPSPTATPTPSPSPTPTPSPKPGDINGDGFVNVVDFSIMLSKWNTSDPGADLNKDGIVNIVDFSILLSNWGS